MFVSTSKAIKASAFICQCEVQGEVHERGKLAGAGGSRRGCQSSAGINSIIHWWLFSGKGVSVVFVGWMGGSCSRQQPVAQASVIALLLHGRQQLQPPQRATLISAALLLVVGRRQVCDRGRHGALAGPGIADPLGSCSRLVH